MRSLKQRTKPFEIELIEGIAVTVRPRTAFDLALAQSKAQARLDKLDESQDVCGEAGLLGERRIDVTNDVERVTALNTFIVDEMAAAHITAWRGVEGVDAPNPAAIRALLDTWPAESELPFREIFWRKFMAGHRELEDAKKDSGAVASGILSPAPVPNIAESAEKRASPAPLDVPA